MSVRSGTAAGAPLLRVENLSVSFDTPEGVVRAAEDVSFQLWPGEVLGVVGESGSGKSVTLLSTLRLIPEARVSGSAWLGDDDLLALRPSELREIRGDRVAVVFQDALSALNPLKRVGAQVAEGIRVHHRDVSRQEAQARAVELLGDVGISDPSTRAGQFPHELSGGMRQRAMIAMALANDPDILIADEPTTALDVTTQAQVLDLLREVLGRGRSAMVLVTHDLGVVAGIADRVLVMYAGRIVETGSAEEVLLTPQHPYTQGLLASRPRLEGADGALPRLAGQPPSLLDVPPGCSFHPRCPYARLPHPCAVDVPTLSSGTQSGHLAACHFRGRLGTPGPALSDGGMVA